MMDPYLARPAGGSADTGRVRVAAGAVVALLAAGVVGSFVVHPGASGAYPGGTPSAVLAAAPAAAAKASTLRLSLDLTVRVNGHSAGVHERGVVDNAAQTAAMTLTAPSGTFPGPIDIIATPASVYFKVPTSRLHATGGKHWLAIPAAQFQQLGGNPSAGVLSALSSLAADGTSPVDLGHAAVHGVATEHYRADIDLKKAAATASPALAASTAAITTYAGTLPPSVIDVWIDGRGLTRRLTQRISLQGVEVTSTFEIGDYGKPARIMPPDQSDTLQEPTLQAALPLVKA